MLKKLLLGNNQNLQKKAFTWNIIASTLAAGQSALMLIFVTRFIGLEDAGVFTLAYSTAQMMLTIGYFDMRSYQVTDVKDPLPFPFYFTSRVITCALMLAVSAFYIIFKQYTGFKAEVIFLACVFKMIDAFEDVIHGLFQKSGRLDVAGKLQTLRYILIIFCFALSLWLGHNLILSLIIATLVSIAVIFCNLPLIKMFDTLRLHFHWAKLRSLFLACLPLFIGSYLASYLENAPKYAIDTYLSSSDQAYYGILAMMAFVVNLFSGFAFRPMLTPLAVHWNNRQIGEYLRIVRRLLLWVAALILICEVGAYLLGIPVLSFIYGTDLSQQKGVLLLVILGGGINSLGTILYHSLTVMRKQRWLLIGYIIAAISAFFIAPAFVQAYGLIGAASAFVLIVTIKACVFLAVFICCLQAAKRSRA